jgi:DMSO/TMAO reductase YedYZ heme-binding membrane subunit
MPSQLMWWMSRATGMVAGLLLVASVVWGVLLATRVLRPIDRPAWLLAMHKWFSLLACIGIALHITGLVADNYVHFGWKEVLVPFGSPWKRVPVALGVVATYMLVIVQVSSVAMRRLPRHVWKAMHYLSYAAVWLGSLHGALAGTDAGNRVYQVVALLLSVLTVTAAILRVVMGTTRHQRARKAASAS